MACALEGLGSMKSLHLFLLFDLISPTSERRNKPISACSDLSKKGMSRSFSVVAIDASERRSRSHASPGQDFAIQQGKVQKQRISLRGLPGRMCRDAPANGGE